MMKEYRFEQISTTYLLGSRMILTPPWEDKNIIIPNNKFYFVVEGEIEITTEEGSTLVRDGELALIPAGKRHSYNLTEKKYAKLFWFHFDLLLDEKKFFDVYSVPLKIRVQNKNHVTSLFNTVFKYAQNRLPFEKIALANSINALASYYLKNCSYKENKVEKHEIDFVIDYIKQNYAEKFTVEKLAQITNFTPTYFIRKFREHTGYSPIYYTSVVKLEEAKYLLEQTSDPINAIMEKVGFDDSAHFSKLFKKRYGFSPSKYRETTQRIRDAKQV